MIISGKEVAKFELLFIMYALGTLLLSTASLEVSNRILKVVYETQKKPSAYDWGTFIFNELCKEIEDYKKQLSKGKGRTRKNVGGCIYFLMVWGFQNFSVGQGCPKVIDALKYWDDDKVNIRIKLEKKSNRGILHEPTTVHGSSSTKVYQESAFVHQEVRRLYGKVLSFVSDIGEELMSLQSMLLGQGSREEEGEKSQEKEDDDKGIDSEGKNEDEKIEEEGLVDEGTALEEKNKEEKLEEEEYNEEGDEQSKEEDNEEEKLEEEEYNEEGAE
ncbi:uncharacterized protein LOC129290161 [Prosopis cineraria]|uniref:uncharacterized protein LOC129290161 n=1 Tax=Prosopis cineraria TaxID=364024 RepID=UPI00240EF140|nr:uncharacterized protein LOC129290161 [Prosopis cineraria]